MTFKFESYLYAMIDTADGHEPVALAQTYLEAGARVMQLRMKNASSRDILAAARVIAELSRKRGATFIVNDRVDLAMLSGADGVHLGEDDLPIEAARKLVESKMLIGISTHNVEQARAAESAGADYIGFGPMYAGGLKENATGKGLAMLSEVRTAVKLPIVAIGGITEARIPDVLSAGANAAAIITDVIRAPDIAAKLRSILALRY